MLKGTKMNLSHYVHTSSNRKYKSKSDSQHLILISADLFLKLLMCKDDNFYLFISGNHKNKPDSNIFTLNAFIFHQGSKRGLKSIHSNRTI